VPTVGTLVVFDAGLGIFGTVVVDELEVDALTDRATKRHRPAS